MTASKLYLLTVMRSIGWNPVRAVEGGKGYAKK
jgi:hypothetical protein